ncbi:MAG TPA: phosphotransferase [Pseudonocardiaceae bacterium]|nr:phosphotransferase [Pseudonocardiaceae bacterium]
MTTRTATLALVDPAGHPLGTLPLGALPSPWWQDTGEVIAAAHAQHGSHVTLLRLLTVDQPAPPGGALTYLAELDGPPPAAMLPHTDPTWTAPHPLRMPWANPGGPTASLAWADRTLAAHGTPIHQRHQFRTWNLSSIWRLDTTAGTVWLKEVPEFHAHEGAVLAWLARPTTPQLIATDHTRMLIADIPGTDRYHAPAAERAAMLTELLDIQTHATHHVPELLALGVPDQRTTPLLARITETIDTAQLPHADRTTLHQLAHTLTELASCGIPDTLRHGDFHPGNVRTHNGHHVILDWADSAIGNPVFDLIRLRGPDGDDALTAQWCAHWRTIIPGSDPERAAALAAPLAALRDAAVYGTFLANIEPTEHPYHAVDVPNALTEALRTSRHA